MCSRDIDQLTKIDVFNEFKNILAGEEYKFIYKSRNICEYFKVITTEEGCKRLMKEYSSNPKCFMRPGYADEFLLVNYVFLYYRRA